MAATMVAVFALQSPSMADGSYLTNCSEPRVSCQTGVEVSGPKGECVTATDYRASTVACVVYDGDYVYVKDSSADGYAAMASVWSGSDSSLRHCRNNIGKGKWVRCNFDWPEAGNHHVEAGYKESSTSMNTMLLWRWSGK